MAAADRRAVIARVGELLVQVGLSPADGETDTTEAPPAPVLPVLPFLGIALNGTSSVLYGTVADFVNPSRIPRAFGLFYTVIISAAAVAPPLFGMLSDANGVPFTVLTMAFIALATLPLAFFLSREMKMAAPADPFVHP